MISSAIASLDQQEKDLGVGWLPSATSVALAGIGKTEGGPVPLGRSARASG